MITFIFWKLVNGKKVTVFETKSYFNKETLRKYYQNIYDFDGIDSVI